MDAPSPLLTEAVIPSERKLVADEVMFSEVVALLFHFVGRR
jgi:hypothetical protein